LSTAATTLTAGNLPAGGDREQRPGMETRPIRLSFAIWL